MNKVLITGASGFIGSFLVEEALRQGLDVYAGVRTTSNLEYLSDKRIKIIELDLSSQEALKVKFDWLTREHGSFDYVIHNAGITYAPAIKDFMTVNYTGTINLINALRVSSMPLKKFVFVSSLAVFGPGNGETFEPIKIGDSPHPISSYGKSKLMAEEYIRSHSTFPYLILNSTAVYGPRDKDFFGLMRLINCGFEIYIGDGRQMISLIYVKDLANAVITVMKSHIVNHSYLLSDGSHYDKEYLVDIIKRILKKKTLKLRLPTTPLRWTVAVVDQIQLLLGKRPFLNIEKVREISSANWTCDSKEIFGEIAAFPQFTLEKGMEETLTWYQKQGWLK